MMTNTQQPMEPMRHLYVITFALILLLASASTASAEIGAVLMSGSYKSVTAGESWYLNEGYILNVEEVNVAREQVWLTIWKHGTEVDSQLVQVGETFVHETEIDDRDYTILRMTVKDINTISSTTLVSFESAYQYSDGSNDPKAAPTTASTVATTTPTVGGTGDILMEYDKLTMSTGESRGLEGGYVLVAGQIDLDGDKVWLTLSRYGVNVDDKVVSVGDTYIYTTENKEYLLLEAGVDAIYRGTDSNLVQLAPFYQYREGTVRYASTTTPTLTPTSTPTHTSATARQTTTDERTYTYTDGSRVAAQSAITAAQSAINDADLFKRDTTEARNLLTRAQTAASNEQYQNAIDYANQAKKSAEKENVEVAKSAALKRYGVIVAALVVAALGLTTSKSISKRKVRVREDARSTISRASANSGYTSATKLSDANSAFQSEKYSKAIALAQEARAFYNEEKIRLHRLDSIKDSDPISETINAIKSKIQSAEFDYADRMIKETSEKSEFGEHKRKVLKAEQSIEEAKNEGAEMPPVVLDSPDKAKGALESHECQKVGETTAAILTKVGDAAEKQDRQKSAIDEINAAKRELTRIEEIGIPSAKLRELLDTAEDAYEKGDYHDSCSIAKECIDRSKEKADEHAKVNIKGSVVQHSEIGSARRCQSCGTEVQADDEFCTECGTKLG